MGWWRCITGAPDRGRLAETVVHGSLARQPNDGLYHWKGRGEVDLLVRGGNDVTRLIQVTTLDDEASDPLTREAAALAEAGSAFPRAARTLVVANHFEPGAEPSLPGVEVVPLWRFLLAGGHGA